MRQTVHIFRKDLRRLRWWLALWVALLTARVLLATAWRLDASGAFGEELLFEQVTAALGVATFVLFGILIARLVQDEPLVGIDWFWLTRPYDRSSLLAAKLAFAALFFIVVPLAAELVVMAAYGAGTWDMLRASTVFLARDGRWTAGLMVFAVLTSTLVGFALGLAATGAAISLALLGLFAVALLRIEEETRPSAAMADATPAIVATTVFIVGCLAVVVYQYHRRRRGRALAIVATGLAAVVAVPSLWPWRMAPPVPFPLPAALAQDAADVTAQVDRASPPEIIEHAPLHRRDARRRRVVLPIELAGLPAGYHPYGIYAESRLELQGGDVLESRQSGGAVDVLVGDVHVGGERPHHLQGVVGEVRVLPVMTEPAAPLVTVLTVTDEQLARHGSERGRLVSTLHIPLQHSRAVGTLPLTAGARLKHDDMQIELLRVQRRHDGCTILLRQWRVTSFLSPPEFRRHEFLLRNIQRQEAYAASGQHRSFGGSSFFFWSLWGLTLDRRRSGFSVEHLWIDYPPRWGPRAERSTIDSQWLAGADFVIVETVPAGVITRTVVLDDFRMQEPASGASP